MVINDNLFSNAILKEISTRFRDYRVDYPLTQKELADLSGVSVRSISRFEAGEDINLSNFIKLVRAVGLTDNLDCLIPDGTIRPSYLLRESKPRYRATPINKRGSKTEWKWGDEK